MEQKQQLEITRLINVRHRSGEHIRVINQCHDWAETGLGQKHKQDKEQSQAGKGNS